MGLNAIQQLESSHGNQVGGDVPDTTGGGRQNRVDALPDTAVVGSRSTCFFWKSSLQ